MKRIFICTFLIALFTSPLVSPAANNAVLLEGDPDSFFEAPNNDVFHNALGNQLTVEAWVFVNDQAGERMVVNKEDSYELGVIDGVFQAALNGGGGWVGSVMNPGGPISLRMTTCTSMPASMMPIAKAFMWP